MNNKKFIKLSIFLFIIIKFNINTVFFLNRFLIPEFLSQPYVSYRRSYQSLSFQPFVMTSNIIHMRNFYGVNESFRGIYEIDGNYHATVIDQSLMNAGVIENHVIPSEWLYNRLFVPIKLNGNIQTSGLGWHLSTEIVENLFMGWSSALCSAMGVIDFTIKPEDEKTILSQGYITDVLDTYRVLNKQLRNASNYMHDYTWADQDVYIRYEWNTDFTMFIQRIKGALQIGTIIPSALEKNIFNPASYMIGTNGHWGLYGSGILDLVLKEDIVLGLNLKIIGQFSNIKMVRLPLLNESSRYGSIVCWMKVSPGITTIFSPYLTIEGLRDGLGVKLSYQTVYHQDDMHTLEKNYNILDKKPLPVIDINRINRLSGWAQEHVGINIFYDFMRIHEEHDAEPFLGLTAYIPVDWFFSKSSAKTYGIMASLEILY